MVVKCHIGSGTVYLDPAEGWVNVNAPVPGVFLASDRPDLVERFLSDERDYYGRHRKTADELRAGPTTTEEVCDIRAWWEALPFPCESVDEILARQVLEHCDHRRVRAILDESDRVLKPNGLLRIDVPDVRATVERYRETGDSFWMRHLLGSERNVLAKHVTHWSRSELIGLCEEHSLLFEAEEPNVNVLGDGREVPCFCLRFRKPGVRAAWEYAPAEMLAVPDDARVLELGPGTRPWPRADIVIDSNQAFLDAAPETNSVGKRVEKVLLDLETVASSVQTKWGSREIDFLFAAHVLEHLSNMPKVVNEINRIAKRGLVIVPSVLKEALFAFEEGEHRWWSMPARNGSKALRMIRADYGWRSRIADPDASGCLARALRTGPFRLDHDARVLRSWFRRVEPALDVMHPWAGSLEVEIL